MIGAELMMRARAAQAVSMREVLGLLKQGQCATLWWRGTGSCCIPLHTVAYHALASDSPGRCCYSICLQDLRVTVAVDTSYCVHTAGRLMGAPL